MNKVHTLGYFTKRLRDNGYIVWKIFHSFNMKDHRKWTVLVNPGQESVFITCYINMNYGEENLPCFTFDDGNVNYKTKTFYSTISVEVILENLLRHNVKPNSKKFKKKEDSFQKR